MRMAVAEALVLLAIGLVTGVLSTVFDVLVLGTASFLSHFSLWVLLNALLAVHVDSRIKAIWWAIPFNLGFVESYFISTVASFESYPKSLMVPLAAIALIAPFLTYGMWTAKRQKNIYGRVLSLLIVAGTLVASFVIDNQIGIYDAIVCAVLAYVLMVMPVRRLKIERAQRVVAEAEASDAAQTIGEASASAAEAAPTRRRRRKRRTPKKTGQDEQSNKSKQLEESVPKRERSASSRPTRRTGNVAKQKVEKVSFRQRRAQREQEMREREERRRASAERRANRQSAELPENGMSTLGNARRARRSNRSA